MFGKILLTIIVSALDIQPSEMPCSAFGDGLVAEAAAAVGGCSQTYCCARCNEKLTVCNACVAGDMCDGHVFSCAGCYSGDAHCAIGTSGSNSCCD